MSSSDLTPPPEDATEVPLQNPSNTVSARASHQHQQEREMLSKFTVPEPPVSTKQLSIAAETEHETDTSALSAPEQPRTLWMGDLDPLLDEAAITNLWWLVLGKSVTVKLIKPRAARMDNSYYGGLTHSGYCFVEFESYKDAQQALALNGQLLPDIAIPSQLQFPTNPDNQKKYFRLNWALGATLDAPIVHSPEYSLFVGDLSASTTEAHLLLFFQKLFKDSIKTVRVMTDPILGKSRCFGFVRFAEESERQRALEEMNGVWFGGRPLRVALATPRNSAVGRKSVDDHVNSPPLGGMGPPEYLYGLHPGPGHLGSPQPPNPYFYFSPLLAEKGGEMPPPPPQMYGLGNPAPAPGLLYLDPNNTTVFIGGLLSDVSEQTLATLFKPFGTIQQIKIPPGKNCGFLKYSSREEAEEAILTMEGFIIGGNRVRLGWGRVSMSNKKFQQRRNQLAHVAQMQAAAAISMGMDPASAYAAVGFPPPPPHPHHHAQTPPPTAQNQPPASGLTFNPMSMGMPPMVPGMIPPYGQDELREEYGHFAYGAPPVIGSFESQRNPYSSDQLADSLADLAIHVPVEEAEQPAEGTDEPENGIAVGEDKEEAK